MRILTHCMLAGVLAASVGAGQAWAQGGPGPSEAEYLGRIRDWSRQLSTDLEYFQQDVATEAKGPRGYQLYQDADVAYKHVRRFNRLLKNGVTREQLYREYGQMDAQLHKMLEGVQGMPAASPLHRSANRVKYADQQLHYALSVGDPAPERGQDVLTRQVDILAQSAADFHQVVRYATQEGEASATLRKHSRAFQEAAEHMRDAMKGGKLVDREHFRRNFADIYAAWKYVVEDLNVEFTPGHYMMTRGRQVHDVLDNLRAQLGYRDPGVRLRDY